MRYEAGKEATFVPCSSAASRCIQMSLGRKRSAILNAVPKSYPQQLSDSRYSDFHHLSRVLISFYRLLPLLISCSTQKSRLPTCYPHRTDYCHCWSARLELFLFSFWFLLPPPPPGFQQWPRHCGLEQEVYLFHKSFPKCMYKLWILIIVTFLVVYNLILIPSSPSPRFLIPPPSPTS